MEKSVVKEYKESSKRGKKRNYHFDEGSSEETVFSSRERFKCEVYLPIMDALSSVLQHHLNSYKTIQEKFCFLSNLMELSKEDIRRAATKLMEYYVDDFEDCFPSELIQFSELYKTVGSREQKKNHRVRNVF